MKKILLLLTMFMTLAGSAHTATINMSQENKDKVVAFYNAAINQKDFTEAEKYLGSRYIQHNPLAADGAEGLKKYLQYLRDTYPFSHSEIKRVFAEGEYVMLHVHSVLVPDSRGRAIVDIFRLENGKIVEHWDAIQEIPEKSANENGMF